MAKEFKYSVRALLNLVREKPCIWDKSLESYKDGMERRQAWREILMTMDETFNDMSQAEQRALEETIISKWTNVRDAFTKNLKNRAAGKKVRKYIHHDDMSFMKRILAPDVDSSDDESLGYTPIKIKAERRKRKSEEEACYFEEETNEAEPQEDVFNVTQKEFVHVRSDDTDPRVMNEDEAFFASLLPTVTRYDLDDRLEFRMEVLALMRRIREKKKRLDD